MPSEELAAIAQVGIFPKGQCGVGAATLNGSGTFCTTTDPECKKLLSNNKVVLFTAKYTIDDLEALAGTIWDIETKNVTFCGRVSLSDGGDTIVSFIDVDFDYHIDLNADFIVGNLQPPSLETELFSKSFSYELEACMCSSLNVCIAVADIPAVQMGQNIRICINTPAGENIEILKLGEWVLEQANTGVRRYAVHDGVEDSLTVIHAMTATNIIASTPLNADFFREPQNGVTLWGLVSVKPLQESRRRAAAAAAGGGHQIRRLTPMVGGTEQDAIFRLDMELVDNDRSGQMVDVTIVVVSLLLLALAIFVVRHQRKNIPNHSGISAQRVFMNRSSQYC
jgi:hypothetical protein